MKTLFAPVLLITSVLAAQDAPIQMTREEMAKAFRAKALDPVVLKKEAAKAGGCALSRHGNVTEDMRGDAAKYDARLEGMSIFGPESHLTGRLPDQDPRTVGKMFVDNVVLNEMERTPRFFEPGERVSMATFKFVKEDGNSQSIGDLKGKVTLLFLFRTDCRWTHHMMGEILRLHGIEEKAGIRVLAVSIVNPGWMPVKQFRKFSRTDLPATFPIYLPSQESASGFDALGELKAVPTTFILDRQGCIAWRMDGAAPGSLADKLNMIRTEL